jgi:uncharacterized damage-inducible protein DinB
MDTSLPLMYNWVKRTRELLFEFLETLPNDVYTQEHPDFAYGSLRNIQAHVVGCYTFWVGQIGSKLEIDRAAFDNIPDVATMRKKFLEMDAILEAAFTNFTDLDTIFEIVRPNRDTLMVSQRWLIMHPITHEFHHKGQFLALARVLGHPIPSHMDADLVLP